jgi:hypothetical protein
MIVIFPIFFLFAINFNIYVSHIIHIKASTLLFLISVNLAIFKGWVEKNRIRNTRSMILFNTERVLVNDQLTEHITEIQFFCSCHSSVIG